MLHHEVRDQYRQRDGCGVEYQLDAHLDGREPHACEDLVEGYQEQLDDETVQEHEGQGVPSQIADERGYERDLGQEDADERLRHDHRRGVYRERRNGPSSVLPEGRVVEPGARGREVGEDGADEYADAYA